VTAIAGRASCLLGYEVGSGEPVEILTGQHLAITGQSQHSGKTTTLEALVSRSPGISALAFVTKRGESAFTEGRRVQPYFRDRADWQFVTSIIDATLQEKNKFLRPWIMKICRNTSSLADVQREVRHALKTAKGINEGVYTQLDAYLDLIVPEIRRSDLAPVLDLRPGLNVMDVSSSPTPMQMLFIQSALDNVNATRSNTVVVIPEAWEMIPEGKGSPVKASAVTLVRKGAGIGNYLWVDSQDMAGVDKTILRQCTLWLIGVQREANELKRNLANIPKSIARPTVAEIATLERGQFYACWAKHSIKTYVQPAWMGEREALARARSEWIPPEYMAVPPRRAPVQPLEDTVNEREAQELRDENTRLRTRIEELEKTLGIDPATAGLRQRAQNERALSGGPVAAGRPDPVSVPLASPNGHVDEEALFQRFRERLIVEAPAALRVLTLRPELEVEVRRQTITVDGASLRGRIARAIAAGFFEKSRTSADVLAELEKRGSRPSNIELANELKALTEMGFLTRENKWFSLVPEMRVNVVER
jgi:hypothetical protein